MAVAQFKASVWETQSQNSYLMLLQQPLGEVITARGGVLCSAGQSETQWKYHFTFFK